jgi:hypothetical protein
MAKRDDSLPEVTDTSVEGMEPTSLEMRARVGASGLPKEEATVIPVRALKKWHEDWESSNRELP